MNTFRNRKSRRRPARESKHHFKRYPSGVVPGASPRDGHGSGSEVSNFSVPQRAGGVRGHYNRRRVRKGATSGTGYRKSHNVRKSSVPSPPVSGGPGLPHLQGQGQGQGQTKSGAPASGMVHPEIRAAGSGSKFAADEQDIHEESFDDAEMEMALELKGHGGEVVSSTRKAHKVIVQKEKLNGLRGKLHQRGVSLTSLQAPNGTASELSGVSGGNQSTPQSGSKSSAHLSPSAASSAGTMQASATPTQAPPPASLFSLPDVGVAGGATANDD